MKSVPTQIVCPAISKGVSQCIQHYIGCFVTLQDASFYSQHNLAEFVEFEF